MMHAEQSPLNREMFRAYDIRGIAGKDLTETSIHSIGRAIAYKLIQLNESAIAIACDGRLSSPQLYQALTQGLIAGGVNVIQIGAVPTPLLYFRTAQLDLHNGIMLTGSHNPKEYNGLKIVIQGKTLKENELQELYELTQLTFSSVQSGKIQVEDIIPKYLQAIRQTITLARSLKIVVDCGNGITGVVAPQLFKALGCDVISLYAEVDGNFPHHHPDPGQPKNMQALIAEVKRSGADLGFAFDGDGDRLGVVNHAGEIIFPDKILMLFAEHILTKQKGHVIFDVKCSSLLRQIISQAGGTPVLWRTGHALIKAKAREINALLAGEMSGHFFFGERWYGFDDALYAACRLLELVAAFPGTLVDMLQHFPVTFSTPEINVPIPEHEKFSFVAKFIEESHFPGGEKITIDGLRVEYPDGFGLLRASNTTPNLVLRFEGETNEALRRIQEEFRTQMSLEF